MSDNTYDERLTKILRDAVLATDDNHALACLGGARRHLAGLSRTGHDIMAWGIGDSSYLEMTRKLVDRAHEEREKSYLDAEKYRLRLAVLERALLAIKSAARTVGGHDKQDYRLKFAIERVRLTDIQEVLDMCRETISASPEPEDFMARVRRRNAMEEIDTWLGNAKAQEAAPQPDVSDITL